MYRVETLPDRTARLHDTEHHLKRHALSECRKSARMAESHVIHVAGNGTRKVVWSHGIPPADHIERHLRAHPTPEAHPETRKSRGRPKRRRTKRQENTTS